LNASLGVEIGSSPLPVHVYGFSGIGELASAHFDRPVMVVCQKRNAAAPALVAPSLWLVLFFKRKSPGRAGAFEARIVNPVQYL
jgi:hypothetical protein